MHPGLWLSWESAAFASRRSGVRIPSGPWSRARAAPGKGVTPHRTRFRLDIGAGIECEHWIAAPPPGGVVAVGLDPLLTAGMVDSGRLQPLPASILRVGGELRPSRSVEKGRPASSLPFRDASFEWVHCGFLLHLYLEIMPLLVRETFRVLAPQGTAEFLIPHMGDTRSDRLISETREEFLRVFGTVQFTRFQGPFTSFWADLYRDRTFLLRCQKGGGAPLPSREVADASGGEPETRSQQQVGA